MTSALSNRVRAAFFDAFGGAPDVAVRAPGRVNLIGEHTDYNDGFVLPCAIGVMSVIAARSRADGQVRVVAADYAMARDAFDLHAPITPREDAVWPNYIRGMVKIMIEAGFALGGADLVLAGDIPQGAGLSSSASVEVAVGQAFKTLDNLANLDPTRLALLAQSAESDFVGCKCGIMDQLISARGVAGHALLIDCRTLETTPAPIPEDWAIMIVHSGVSRGLVDGAYNERRAQCEAAARHYRVAALRDLDEAALKVGRGGLDPLVYRRARHVVTENRRTTAAARALKADDIVGLGRLMAQSHASMRDDFEITVAPVDRLVSLLQAAIGEAGGARMTGGGFGGAVVAVLRRDRLDTVRADVLEHYRAPQGRAPLIMIETACAGAGIAA